MDFSIITIDNLIFMLKGTLLSLLIAATGVLLGVILGVIGAAGKISKNRILNGIATAYIELFRGTPMMMQITFAYLALPAIISKIAGHFVRFNPLITGIVAIGINSGAYTSELIRSGILGIDKGQWEAADTLGLSYKQKMSKIILPQAFKRIIPPLVSEFITLIKDSSLLSTIGVVELMKTATTIGSNYYAYIPPLTVASIIYLIINLIISSFAKKLERRLALSD